MTKNGSTGHSQDYDRKHNQAHDSKKQTGPKPIIEDTRNEVRQENTNHFTNRAPGKSK